MHEDDNTLALAAAAGLVAGMRSMSAPAFVSRGLSRGPGRRGDTGAAALLASRTARRALAGLAVGEMIADKTPYIPARIAPLSLAGRALMGALSAAAIAGRRRQAPLAAVAVGAASAVASTFVSYHLRKAAGSSTKAPDPAIALAEDAIVLAAGSQLADGIARF